MKIFARILTALALFALATSTSAADVLAGKAAGGDRSFGKLSGSWSAYSGALGDETGPRTASDTKVSLTLKGALADDLFKRLGVRARVKECIPDNIIEWCRRGDLDCIRDKDKGLECYIGPDLRTGYSIIATEC